MKRIVEMFRKEVEMRLFDNAAHTYCVHYGFKNLFDEILEETGLRKEVMNEVEILVEYLIEKK